MQYSNVTKNERILPVFETNSIQNSLVLTMDEAFINYVPQNKTAI